MNAFPSSASDAPRPVQTVLGPIAYQRLGLTDGHNHVWIDLVSGVDPGAPVLNRFDSIAQELRLFHVAGGASLLDCQPGGCGRDGNRLAQLARESGVNIIACTGFHRRKYYPPGASIFDCQAVQAADLFTRELTAGLEECASLKNPPLAGFIKVALEKTWAESPLAALEGAASAARQTGALVEVHTEKGSLAEKATLYFESQGVAPQQLVLCHMDKRPDASLHIGLAKYGVLLEYDTFYRPKYEPESNLWPLIQRMEAESLSDHLVLATDMAEPEQYYTLGGGPGLASLPAQIAPRLAALGFPERSIRQMVGGNIARRLAGIC